MEQVKYHLLVIMLKLLINRSNVSACKCYEKAGEINKADDEIIYVYDFKEKN